MLYYLTDILMYTENAINEKELLEQVTHCNGFDGSCYLVF